MQWLKLRKDDYMTGPEVTRLQEILQYLGYDLGPGGMDGVFGPVTSECVKQFQRKFGLISDGCVGNLETWPILMQVLEAQVRKNPSTEPEIKIVDRREQHAPPGLYREDLSPLKWSGDGDDVIRGVTLHQSGSLISEVGRVFDIGNFHISVLTNGRIQLTNPLNWYIGVSGELSGSTIGIEFEGNFPGVSGKAETVWNEGSALNHLTDAQIKASEYLFAWLNFQFKVNGGKWEYVYAHRQSSAERRADPGSEIWQKIGMKWIKWLGGSDGGPEFKVGDGYPIPKDWNPDYPSEY